MSLLLDTNVLSDLRRPRPENAALFRWRDTVEATPKYLSVISVVEIEYGILRAEERHEHHAPALRRWMDDYVLKIFGQAILSVDLDVALACAKLQRIRTLPRNDSLIAATALVHGLTVVTRNERDFSGLGIFVLNPWSVP